MAADDEDVPYTRLAFNNVPNYLALIGGGVLTYVGFATFGWAPLAAVLGLEALWLAIGARTGSFRRYFDFIHKVDRRRLEDGSRQKHLANLSDEDRRRYLELEQIKKSITDQVEQNPSLHMAMVKDELEKLGKLADAFLQIASNASRYESFVREQDLDDIESEVRVQEQLLERTTDEEARKLARRNLDVLRRRLEKAAELRQSIRTSRGQLNLIENTLRLLRDQIVTMSSPGELSGQIEELTFAMDAIEASGSETEALVRKLRASSAIANGSSR
jgi:DNA repair exonuclease SbcCD ATPase subunit